MNNQAHVTSAFSCFLPAVYAVPFLCLCLPIQLCHLDVDMEQTLQKKGTTVFITVGYSSTPYLFYLFDFIAECFTVPLFIKKKQFSYVAVIKK